MRTDVVVSFRGFISVILWVHNYENHPTYSVVTLPVGRGLHCML